MSESNAQFILSEQEMFVILMDEWKHLDPEFLQTIMQRKYPFIQDGQQIGKVLCEFEHFKLTIMGNNAFCDEYCLLCKKWFDACAYHIFQIYIDDVLVGYACYRCISLGKEYFQQEEFEKAFG